MQHIFNATLNMMARWPDDKFDNMRRVLRESLTSEQYSRLINMRADLKQNDVTQIYASFTLR
jgi:hypothetical protein